MTDMRKHWKRGMHSWHNSLEPNEMCWILGQNDRPEVTETC